MKEENKRVLFVFDKFIGWERTPVAVVAISNLLNGLKLFGWKCALLTLGGDSLQPDFLKIDERREEFLTLLSDSPIYKAKGWIPYPKEVFSYLLRRKGKASFRASKSIGSSSLKTKWGRKFIEWVGSLIFSFWESYVYCYKQMVKEGMKGIKEFKPSIIISTYPGGSNLTVASRLSTLSGVPWVAYIRDPFYNKFKEMLMRPVLNSASAIISVMDKFDYPRRRPPLYALHHGYDPSKYPKVSLLPTFTITSIIRGYVAEWLILRFLRVLYHLKEEGILARFPLKVRFYMSNPHPLLQEWIKMLHLQDLIELHPPISHTEMLLRECESTLLLLIRWRSMLKPAKYIYSLKFWEFVGAGRPILRIGHPDDAEAEMLNKLRVGVNLESEEDIYCFLRKALNDFYTKGDIDWNPDREAVFSFALPNLAQKWDEILKKKANGGDKILDPFLNYF
jgi:hypothetical protein